MDRYGTLVTGPWGGDVYWVALKRLEPWHQVQGIAANDSTRLCGVGRLLFRKSHGDSRRTPTAECGGLRCSLGGEGSNYWIEICRSLAGFPCLPSPNSFQYLLNNSGNVEGRREGGAGNPTGTLQHF